MNEFERDVGSEILEGLRELKRGEHGRVINVPDVVGIRKEAGGTDRPSNRRTPGGPSPHKMRLRR